MDDFDLAKNLIADGEYACIVVKKGEAIYTSKERGIFPLFEAKEILKIDLRGASLADRIVGKAAAMIAVESGIISIHGQVMSENAVKYIQSHEIGYSYDKWAEYIKNREQTGMCPVETRAITTDDYRELEIKVRDFLKSTGVI